jgi:hypothetical protein
MIDDDLPFRHVAAPVGIDDPSRTSCARLDDVRGAALVVMALACHSEPRSDARSVAPHVIVRMARDGEFPPRPAMSTAELLNQTPGESCALEGEPVPAITDAVVGFARANLIHELDQYTGYTTKKIEIEVDGGKHERRTRHAAGFFTDIFVQPRSKLGAVRLSQFEVYRDPNLNGNGWGADISYCMHVRVDHDLIEVILEEWTRGIG